MKVNLGINTRTIAEVKYGSSQAVVHPKYITLFLSVPQRDMGLGLEPRETRKTRKKTKDGVLMDWTTAWVKPNVRCWINVTSADLYVGINI